MHPPSRAEFPPVQVYADSILTFFEVSAADPVQNKVHSLFSRYIGPQARSVFAYRQDFPVDSHRHHGTNMSKDPALMPRLTIIVLRDQWPYAKRSSI